MSNTRENGDAGSAVPIGLEVPEQTVPLTEDGTWSALSDMSGTVAGAGDERSDEDELLVRDARAALATGDAMRADALECARALQLERLGRAEEALNAWRTAFEREPGLLLAYWGLRRSLEGRGAWDELLRVFERRLRALAPAEGRGADAATVADRRAAAWLAHGRTLEDRLGREDEAARSYRTGLIEAPGHTGLLFSLLLLGWRRSDVAMTAEALAGLLRLPLPGGARAALTAAVARIDRGAAAAAGPVDALAATRALETLRGALGAVDAEHWGPLVTELWVLARGTTDPLARVEILRELTGRLPTEPPEVIVGLLRERARLLRDQLGDKRGAEATLWQALKTRPVRASVVTELADLIEDLGAEGSDGVDGGARVADRLAELLAAIGQAEPGAEHSGPVDTGLRREVALRYLLALVREGRAAEGAAFVARHPELDGEAPELRAIQVVLQALTGDRAGLIAGFDGRAAASNADPVPDVDGAWPLIVAGTLRERAALATEALSSHREAVARAPDDEMAGEALERCLRARGDWSALATRWQARLAVAPADAGVGLGQRRRLLEELVAVTRDELGDLAGARRHQARLVALEDTGRAHLRLLDLELAEATDESPQPAAATLQALGDHAGAANVQTALHVEAGLAHAAAGARREAEELLRGALALDPTGRAASALEGLLTGDAGGQADVVRAELARTQTEQGAEAEARMAALRFRAAYHLVAAGRAGEAIAALEPLLSANAAAAALAWEIARQSGEPALASVVLDAPGAAADLRVPTDRADAREAAGDLSGAAAAFRDVLRAEPSADAALGLLRTGAALGDPALAIEAGVALVPFADEETRQRLTRDVELLRVLARPSLPGSPGAVPAADNEDEASALLSWVAATENADVVSSSAGLLAVARVMRDPGVVLERNAVLGRAAARARTGGAGLAGAVHDQVVALSNGAASIEVGLSDLPVAGRAERASARATRAAVAGGRLGYALDVERAIDAETRGDVAVALAAYLRAAERDTAGLEALEGVRRVALATGNRLAAARAGMRLGAVLRTPHRAAVEFRRAAAIWQEEGFREEAKIAAWQALAREPGSDAVFEFLNGVLVEDADWTGLERLLSLRVGVVTDGRARVPVWLQRATNRLQHLDQADEAIHDFKRMLRVAPEHPAALRALATLATERGYLLQAIDYLNPLLRSVSDSAARRDLILELARAYEATRQGPRALALVKEAIAARPADDVPREAMVELLLRTGDWSGARAALETWQAGLTDDAQAARRAGIWVRIGGLLRDRGRDRRGAEAAFTRASTLDPMGEGVLRLAELHARFDDPDAQRSVLDAAIAEARRVLATDPFDVPRLRRLRDLYTARATGTDVNDVSAQGIAAVGQILSSLGVSEAALSGRLAPLRGTASPGLTTTGAIGPGFAARLRAPGAAGFAGEIWAKIAATAAEMFEGAAAKAPLRERVGAGSEPRLAWIEAAAATVGLPTLELVLSKRADAAEDAVVAIDGSQPALIVGRAALMGAGPVRFRVGRALSLLQDRASMLEARTPEEMASLFTAASLVAGASPGEGARPSAEVAGYAKNMQRLMGRKERKALELEVSRFAFEPVDGAAFQAAVLATADRLGLMLAGSIEPAVRVICGASAPTPAQIAANPRAIELLRFALSAEYLALRRDSEAGAL